MAVLINQNTGLAEDLPQQQADAALQDGSHALPLNDPEGNPVIAPLAEAQNLISQGYSQPNPDQLTHLVNQAKFSSPTEQLKTFGEHAASTATFGLSRGAEAALFKNQEEQRARSEVNPGVGLLGDVAGLGASTLLPGAGAAGLLGKAGIAAQKATGLTSGIAGAATRLAAEGALFQAGDEVGKMFEQDPEQSIGSAIAHTGMAAVLTPIMGVPIEGAQSLWSSTIGRKLTPYLDAAKEKLGIGMAAEAGVPLTRELTPEVEKMLEKFPEMKGYLGNNPTGEQVHQHMLKADTSYGRQYREKLDGFKKGLTDDSLSQMGYKPEDLSSLANKSNFETGKDLQKTLTETLEQKYKPFEKQYADIEAKYSQIPLDDQAKSSITTKIQEMMEKEGYNLSPSSPQFKEIDRVLKEIPNSKNLSDLKNYTSRLSENTNSPELWRVGKQLRGILNETRNDLVTNALGATEGAEALQSHLATNAEYKKLASLIDDLDGQIRVPKWNGPGSFIKSLKEMAPEDILSRLSDKNNVGLIQTLQQQFPDVAQTLAKTFRDQEIRSAITRNGEFNLKSLVSNADKKMTNEYKEFVFGDSLNKAKENAELLSDISFTDNPSGTAAGIDKLFGKVPLHLGAIGLLAHGNPILAALTEFGGHFFSREAPDAVRMAWLRFLGQNHATDPIAFKALVEAANKAVNGAKAIDKAVKTIIPAAGHITIEEFSDKKRAHLENAAEEFQKDPSKFLNLGGDLGRYEPNHAAAMGATVSNALSVINEAKPKIQPENVLDAPRVPSEVEKEKYERTLENVENPMNVLKHISDGTLTADDMQTFQRVYPGMHKMLVQKFTDQVVDAKAKGTELPYHVVMSLSLFMGMPLDSTLTPQFIASNQPQPQQQQAPQGPQQPKGQRGSKKALDKWASNEMTPTEKRMQSKNA